MVSKIIKFFLIFLFVFTPIFFGAMEFWALSVMELGILLIILLAAIEKLIYPQATIHNPLSKLPILLLSLFLVFILFQMFPLPSGLIKILSPKTH